MIDLFRQVRISLFVRWDLKEAVEAIGCEHTGVRIQCETCGLVFATYLREAINMIDDEKRDRSTISGSRRMRTPHQLSAEKLFVVRILFASGRVVSKQKHDRIENVRVSAERENVPKYER